MAKPMSPDQLVSQLKKWDVPFREHPGWRTHRRDPGHGPWNNVHGILIHHTGDDAPDSADERLLWDGRSDLPGPLCNWGMRDDGTLVLISAGRANHAGMGGANVFDALVNESYGQYPPTAGADTVDGNSNLYGQETMYSGTHRMTDAQYNSTLKAFAAVCEFHGWSAKSVIGHKEWTRRKPDPAHMDMAQLRSDLAKVLKAGPGNHPTTSRPAKKDSSATNVSRFGDKLDEAIKAGNSIGSDRAAARKVLDDVKAARKNLPIR